MERKSPSLLPDDSRARFALVGTGGRSWMFTQALSSTYRDRCALVALCDTNQTRMDFYNREIAEKCDAEPVPTYLASDFDRMVREQRPDVVIVSSIDRTHHEYIVRAMELGCDVITEKPLTIDIEKCEAILDAVARTGRKLTVTFNYRYAPLRTKVKELLMEGAIGEVKSVHFEWLLDTNHGADYFRRWHRDKRNSGGLMVHKATHHFDLVNWWLESSPETVFAFGNLGFYGRENALRRGVSAFYERGTEDSAAAASDPFALDLRKSENLRHLYLDAEHEDGYRRDQSVFSDGITIEDTMNVLVRYKSGVQMSYSLYTYAPWEGYRIALNGTKGRIEVNHQEASYINAGTGSLTEGKSSSEQIILLPLFQKPVVVEIPPSEGGHGGGDPVMLDEIFGGKAFPDPFHRAANHIDGARSILTGIAANESFRTGLPVKVDSLLRLEEWTTPAVDPLSEVAAAPAGDPAVLAG
ncbi:MAG: dehydrogenase [Verrucomicrobia bacterium 61-8]|nr:Gfo/Idh/MocA family oxidoreductase [Verrucomicrobiota bacterium]OJV15146.1 MAG: dehydrogenase [Verrucomicrobia bacterium 61-8]